MPHCAIFHHGLHCLLDKMGSSETEIQYFVENVVTSLNISIDNPDLIVCR